MLKNVKKMGVATPPFKNLAVTLASGVAPDSGVDDQSKLPHSSVYANTSSIVITIPCFTFLA